MKSTPLRRLLPLATLLLCLFAAPVAAQKNAVGDWDTTAGNNTDVGGISIAEGMSPGDVNNAIREIMAQIATLSPTSEPAGTVKAYVGTTAPSGYLLLNGDTLGSAASTATQKSDDYQTLYELIWNSMADAEAPVGGGRGASANADWTANKTITLPDATGRFIGGKESTATRLTAAGSGVDGATLGETGGAETHTLTTAEMPAHTHTGTFPNINNFSAASSGTTVNRGTGASATGSTGSGDAHNNVAPAIILNWIIKT